MVLVANNHTAIWRLKSSNLSLKPQENALLKNLNLF